MTSVGRDGGGVVQHSHKIVTTKTHHYSMDWTRCRPIGNDDDENEELKRCRAALETLQARHNKLTTVHQNLTQTLHGYLSSLETRVFTRAKRNDECVVCYSEFQKDAAVVLCVECCNGVCKDCFGHLNKVCPMCKTKYTVFKAMLV